MIDSLGQTVISVIIILNIVPLLYMLIMCLIYLIRNKKFEYIFDEIEDVFGLYKGFLIFEIVTILLFSFTFIIKQLIF